jgi:hypothetical protein
VADGRVVDDRASAPNAWRGVLETPPLVEPVLLGCDPPKEDASALITHAYTSRKNADGAREWYNN